MKLFKQPEDYSFKQEAVVGEYVIYSYTNELGKKSYTYWYGNEDGQYISSLENLEAAEASVCMRQYKSLAFHNVMVCPTDPNLIVVLLTRSFEMPIVCNYMNVYDGYLDQFSKGTRGIKDEEVCISLMNYFDRKRHGKDYRC